MPYIEVPGHGPPYFSLPTGKHVNLRSKSLAPCQESRISFPPERSTAIGRNYPRKHCQNRHCGTALRNFRVRIIPRSKCIFNEDATSIPVIHRSQPNSPATITVMTVLVLGLLASAGPQQSPTKGAEPPAPSPTFETAMSKRRLLVQTTSPGARRSRRLRASQLPPAHALKTRRVKHINPVIRGW